MNIYDLNIQIETIAPSHHISALPSIQNEMIAITSSTDVLQTEPQSIDFLQIVNGRVFNQITLATGDLGTPPNFIGKPASDVIEWAAEDKATSSEPQFNVIYIIKSVPTP